MSREIRDVPVTVAEWAGRDGRGMGRLSFVTVVVVVAHGTHLTRIWAMRW
jgi:hypothetical protein